MNQATIPTNPQTRPACSGRYSRQRHFGAIITASAAHRKCVVRNAHGPEALCIDRASVRRHLSAAG